MKRRSFISTLLAPIIAPRLTVTLDKADLGKTYSIEMVIIDITNGEELLRTLVEGTYYHTVVKGQEAVGFLSPHKQEYCFTNLDKIRTVNWGCVVPGIPKIIMGSNPSFTLLPKDTLTIVMDKAKPLFMLY